MNRQNIRDLIKITDTPVSASRSSGGYLFYCKPPHGCGATFETAAGIGAHRQACPAQHSRQSGTNQLPHELYQLMSPAAPFQCPQCEERFLAFIALGWHVKEHHQ